MLCVQWFSHLLLQKSSLLDVNYLLENMLEECDYHKQARKGFKKGC